MLNAKNRTTAMHFDTEISDSTGSLEAKRKWHLRLAHSARPRAAQTRSPSAREAYQRLAEGWEFLAKPLHGLPSLLSNTKIPEDHVQQLIQIYAPCDSSYGAERDTDVFGAQFRFRGGRRLVETAN